ncbi:MAG: DUF1902 domain-containing protein [Defluviitaleaceae bacterium]|nr:DUF1902 domain-containing protein [Defluviitaleaceae bacterium]
MLGAYKINFIWDNEAQVWIATSDDLHGLILEHESFEGLIHEVQLAIPMLLEIEEKTFTDLTLDFVAHRQERLAYSG